VTAVDLVGAAGAAVDRSVRRAEWERWAMAGHLRCQTATDHGVVGYFAGLGRNHDKVTPSWETIAAAIGKSVRSVGRSIARLTAAGLWDKFTDRPRRRPDGSWYRERTNWYRLSWRFTRVTPGQADMTKTARLCDSEAIGPGRRRPQAARPSSRPVPMRLFDPDPPDPPPDEPRILPWIRHGLADRGAWLEWCKTHDDETTPAPAS